MKEDKQREIFQYVVPDKAWNNEKYDHYTSKTREDWKYLFSQALLSNVDIRKLDQSNIQSVSKKIAELSDSVLKELEAHNE